MNVAPPLPSPLTTAECDLRGSKFMPLFGDRLFGSVFYANASAAEFRACIKLRWVAWLQCPAGSLPNDDTALCRHADLGRDLRAWKRIKAGALHGFELCSDGRLYHAELCIAANEEFDRLRKDRERKATRRPEPGISWEVLRRAVFERDDYICQYCGVPADPPHCEHEIPASRGGKTAMDNLVTSCVPCNLSKGARTPAEWRAMQ